MWLKKSLTVLFGIILSLVLCEIILKIYNPFQSRVRGNEIILKSNYKRNVVIDPPIKGLQNQFTYSTNSIGFRGPEPPKGYDWNKALTILTIGGSTTECSLLADDSTWSAHLYQQLKGKNPNVWLNNAGLDGCSTYGHIILMRDYVVKLKPDYAVFLIGINDLVKSSFDNEDGFLIKRKESFWRTLLKKSELFTLISNLVEASKSSKVNVAHGNDPNDYKNNDLNKPDSNYRKELNLKLTQMIPEYTKRVAEIHQLCKSAGIQPIFVTQPKFDDTASNSWRVMDLYNKALTEFCVKNSIPCIQLGDKMPRSLDNYYDQIHFTNKGASVVADILYPEIFNIINQKQ